MTCSNCGKEIKEGASYCLECGADIEAPVVLKEIKTKVAGGDDNSDGNESPQILDKFFDFSKYVKELGSNTSTLVALFGAILVYLSSFYSWMWIEQNGEKISSNLFELGGKNADIAFAEKILIVMAVLIMLSAIDMIAFSACSCIRPLVMFKDNYFVRALPIILTVFFFAIIMGNNDYSHYIESINIQEEAIVGVQNASSFSGGRGVGPIMLIVGQVLYGISIFLDYTKRNK